MIFAKIKLHLFITNLKRSKHKRRLDVDSYRRMQRDALFTTITDLIGISISQPPALFIGPQPRPWPPDPALGPSPQLAFPGSGSNFCFQALDCLSFIQCFRHRKGIQTFFCLCEIMQIAKYYLTKQTTCLTQEKFASKTKKQ